MITHLLAALLLTTSVSSGPSTASAGGGGTGGPSTVTGADGGLVTITHLDAFPATQNITAADVASTTTSGQNSQALITGAPTAGSAAVFGLGLPTTSVRTTISGTWTGSISIESTENGTIWTAVGLHVVGTSFNAGTWTANGTGVGPVSGAIMFRARATSWVSGTATISVVQSELPISSYVTNPVRLLDGSGTSSQATVKAASTSPAATDTALVVALSPNGNQVSIEGTDGGTPQVSVTNFPATQPVSGSVSVSNFPASQAVTGTFFQATQPVSLASLPTVFVAGIDGGVVNQDTAPAAQTLGSNGASCTIQLTGLQGASFQVAAGTFRGTFTNQLSYDNGTTWIAADFSTPGTTWAKFATTVFAGNNTAFAGVVSNPSGARQARMTVTVYTSGTCQCQAQATMGVQTDTPTTSAVGTAAPAAMTVQGGGVNGATLPVIGAAATNTNWAAANRPVMVGGVGDIGQTAGDVEINSYDSLAQLLVDPNGEDVSVTAGSVTIAATTSYTVGSAIANVTANYLNTNNVNIYNFHVTGTVSGTLPTLAFSVQDLSAQDGTTLISGTLDTCPTATATGFQCTIRHVSLSGLAKVTATIGGSASPSFGGVDIEVNTTATQTLQGGLGDQWTYSSGSTSTTALVAIKSALPGASVYYYVTDISFYTSVTSTATLDQQPTLQSCTSAACGGSCTVIWSCFASAFGGCEAHFSAYNPIKAAANTSVCWQNAATLAASAVTVNGFTAP